MNEEGGGSEKVEYMAMGEGEIVEECEGVRLKHERCYSDAGYSDLNMFTH